ncbi:hypothetical protein CEV34_5074 [Brucella pseudogrignonensis]|uniref:Uncharacterized protein n=1 Tax=Brucella pseudogrignonensis TaxID=419475 RepID=A0A256G2V5_9HYPH|nr:hypothetical protein CEV34_5074 [Brucella pseudogrignonensis]
MNSRALSIYPSVAGAGDEDGISKDANDSLSVFIAAKLSSLS